MRETSSDGEAAMHAWRARQVRVYVPGDTPQWCIDNGDDDLIPCGSGDTGNERASKLAETLNLGRAVRAREAGKSPIENQLSKQPGTSMRNARRLI
jgi:hypothetical protein